MSHVLQPSTVQSKRTCAMDSRTHIATSHHSGVVLLCVQQEHCQHAHKMAADGSFRTMQITPSQAVHTAVDPQWTEHMGQEPQLPATNTLAGQCLN